MKKNQSKIKKWKENNKIRKENKIKNKIKNFKRKRL